MPTQLLVWDRFPLIRQALARLLAGEPDMLVVGECADAASVQRHLAATRPDVLVAGMSGRVGETLDELRDLRDEGALPRELRVVLFADALPERIVVEALRLDVRGMILKDMSPDLLVGCIRKVAAGERWLERDSHLAALQMLIAEQHGMQHHGVTARELEVLRLLGTGMSNRAIAQRMSLSEGTIKALVQRLFQKLDAENRVGLVVAATERKLI